jgi:hypothetical protein
MAKTKKSPETDAKGKSKRFIKRPRIKVEYDKLHDAIIKKIETDLKKEKQIDPDFLQLLVRKDLGYFHPIAIKWIANLLMDQSSKIPKAVMDDIKSKDQEIVDLKNEISELNQKLKLNNIS